MTRMFSALTLSAAMLIGGGHAAAAITVPFTFTGFTTAPGTVTGRLVFAAAGSGVQATGLYIDSATNFVTGFEGYNFIAGGTAYANSFTVAADGTVSAASLYVNSAYGYGASPGTVARNYLYLNYGGGYNLFEQDYANYYNGRYFMPIQNQGGLSGVTYNVSSPAPEPAAWALLVAGFGLTGAALRRRKVAVAFG